MIKLDTHMQIKIRLLLQQDSDGRWIFCDKEF